MMPHESITTDARNQRRTTMQQATLRTSCGWTNSILRIEPFTKPHLRLKN